MNANAKKSAARPAHTALRRSAGGLHAGKWKPAGPRRHAAETRLRPARVTERAGERAKNVTRTPYSAEAVWPSFAPAR